MHINHFETLTKRSFFMAIIGKPSIWELRLSIKHASLLHRHVLGSLKFKYKVQSQLNTLYHEYELRQDTAVFEQQYLIRNSIIKEDLCIKICILDG